MSKDYETNDHLFVRRTCINELVKFKSNEIPVSLAYQLQYELYTTQLRLTHVVISRLPSIQEEPIYKQNL